MYPIAHFLLLTDQNYRKIKKKEHILIIILKVYREAKKSDNLNEINKDSNYQTIHEKFLFTGKKNWCIF